MRVIDADTGASAGTRTRGFPGAVIAVFAAAMVLAIWVSSGSGGPGEATLPEPASLSSGEPAGQRSMPELTGLTLETAAAVLRDAGFASFEVEWSVEWRASARRPAGEILTQTPRPGSAVESPMWVTVVLSEGGPVVGFSDLPRDVQAFATALPDFDPDEPLLAAVTPAGIAYKTDDWLFGECSAVELAYRISPDAAYNDRCFVRETVSIRGILVDGTRYTVWGLPPGDYDRAAPSGVIVYDDGSAPRALGITTYARSPRSDAAVAFDGGSLFLAAGDWSSTVAIYDAVLASLPHSGAELVELVEVGLVDGHLVVGLEPPLRWQRPGELPSRIAADYGPFQVVAGCAPDPARVVCDPSGTISVEGVQSGFEVAGVAIRVDATDVTRQAMVDPLTGLGWELPVSWQIADDRLTSVTFPREVFTAGTHSLRAGGVRCAHMPENALRDLGPEDVMVTVFVGGQDGLPPWPRPMGWEALETERTDAHECAERWEMRAGIGTFNMDTVPLLVLVAMGDDVPAETEIEVWRMLDSIDIVPNIWWTP